MDTLHLEMRAADALAKAEALEAALEDVLSKVELPYDDPKAHTREYVQGHNIHKISMAMAMLEGPFLDGAHLASSVP